MLFETFETCQTYQGGLLIGNFQMRLEMRCVIWNFWNFSTLSQECCLFETFRWHLKWDMLFETFETCLKLETVKTCNGSCLFQTFRSDLKKDVMFQTFETWNFSNFSNPSKEIAYWKLLDEAFEMRFAIWNFWNFSNLIMECCLLETVQMRLEMRCCLLETCQTRSLKKVAYVPNISDETWNEMCYLKLVKSYHGGIAYLKLSDQTWNEMCY